MGRTAITPRERDAIADILLPAVRRVVRDFDCSATTVGRLARVVADGVPETQPLTLADIQSSVAKHCQVSHREMLSDRHPGYIIRPRHIAMYLSREMTTKSLPQIGRAFNRDHTTVLAAVRKIERLRREDPALDADVRALMKELGA